MKRHGSYERTEPPGARVPRWYCPLGHATFSQLPDCLAAKLPGSLGEVEQVLRAVEQAPSIEMAADKLRPDILLPGRLRWVRRRTQSVRAALAALILLCPAPLGGCEPTLSSVGGRLQSEQVLATLRSLGLALRPPLAPPRGCGSPEPAGRGRQHDSGARAPPGKG